ncbi:hypothetical protein GGR55DRAFT_564566 [Xylaria sp. FL0064]|nr:hypothetical protein GGR55DRAFT_564566 [Xylaria sp. FL0064]
MLESLLSLLMTAFLFPLRESLTIGITRDHGHGLLQACSTSPAYCLVRLRCSPNVSTRKVLFFRVTSSAYPPELDNDLQAAPSRLKVSTHTDVVDLPFYSEHTSSRERKRPSADEPS